MMIKRYLVFVDGRVQGVGFRSFCMLEAQKRHLTGTVKNLSSGMVEIHIQGNQEMIDDFLATVQKGNHFSIVTDISVKQIPVIENEKKFTYGW